MNKIDMKKVVKDRIGNQKRAISSKRVDAINKMARDFYNSHKPVRSEYYVNEALKNLTNWEVHFEKEFGGIDRMYNMSSAISYLNGSSDYNYDLIRSAIISAANNTDPFSSYDHRWLRESPFKDEIAEVFAEAKKEFYDKPRDLDKLELELLSVITSAKNAKVAAEQLEELGITLDVPEAKKVVSTLPAVVKLSVDATLFNKDVAKS